MTLHWWMHWFWITCLIFSACSCNPLPSEPADALETEQSFQTADRSLIATSEIPFIGRGTRTGKAIGHSPKNPQPIILSTPLPLPKLVFPLATSSDLDDEGPSSDSDVPLTVKSKKDNVEYRQDIKADVIIPSVAPIQIQNVTNKSINNTDIISNKTKEVTYNQTENKTIEVVKNETVINSNETVASGEILTFSEAEITTEQTLKNFSEEVIPIDAKINKNESVQIVNDVDEPEVSTVKALSLETAVGRRAADIPKLDISDLSNKEHGGLDAAAVAGICFGILVLLALTGATSFVLYRRRYLNKPQTLNDKCSNPDSSGYIDDSTIRENSEEMYSLDNDSFLNSLEAMTIQNYWTDSVKHTKL